MIPIAPDWQSVFDNFYLKARLRPGSVCRVAGLSRYTPARWIDGADPRYSTAAAILNLHAKLMPDVPIPEKPKK